LGVPTELAPCCRKSFPGQCFAGYEKFDVLWHEKKIAGAAQRRMRHGLLIQGSIQPPPLKLARADWEAAMCRDIQWRPFEPTAAFHARVAELIAKTYSQESQNRRR
jgi:lipoate-protein ligase A